MPRTGIIIVRLADLLLTRMDGRGCDSNCDYLSIRIDAHNRKTSRLATVSWFALVISLAILHRHFAQMKYLFDGLRDWFPMCICALRDRIPTNDCFIVLSFVLVIIKSLVTG